MPPGYGNDNDNDDNSHSEDVDSTDFTTSWEIYFLKKSGGGGLRFEENQKRLTALKFLRY